MSQPNEWLSIADAAQHLGVTDRHCRRLAALLDDEDRRTDTLPTGRRRLAVRAVAIERAHGKPDADNNPPRADPVPDMSGPPAATPPMQLAAERVIGEQAARIASLEATQAQLLDALKLAQENLAREQTLRALPQPAAQKAGIAAEPSESETRPRRRWPWQRPPTE